MFLRVTLTVLAVGSCSGHSQRRQNALCPIFNRSTRIAPSREQNPALAERRCWLPTRGTPPPSHKCLSQCEEAIGHAFGYRTVGTVACGCQFSRRGVWASLFRVVAPGTWAMSFDRTAGTIAAV